MSSIWVLTSFHEDIVVKLLLDCVHISVGRMVCYLYCFFLLKLKHEFILIRQLGYSFVVWEVGIDVFGGGVVRRALVHVSLMDLSGLLPFSFINLLSLKLRLFLLTWNFDFILRCQLLKNWFFFICEVVSFKFRIIKIWILKLLFLQVHLDPRLILWNMLVFPVDLIRCRGWILVKAISFYYCIIEFFMLTSVVIWVVKAEATFVFLVEDVLLWGNARCLVWEADGSELITLLCHLCLVYAWWLIQDLYLKIRLSFSNNSCLFLHHLVFQIEFFCQNVLPFFIVLLLKIGV